MSRNANKRVVKIGVAIFLAVVMSFVCKTSYDAFALTTFVDKIYVFSQPVHGGEGVVSPYYMPTKVYTIPAGDAKLVIGIKVDPAEGDPTSTHAVLQQRGALGWKNIASAWIPTDGKAQTPFGIMNVKPGEQYRLICSCTPDKQEISTIYVTVSFVSRE